MGRERERESNGLYLLRLRAEPLRKTYKATIFPFVLFFKKKETKYYFYGMSWMSTNQNN